MREIAPRLPQNLDAERAILGAVLLDNSYFAEATKFVQASDFYHPLHPKIFRAMMTMLDSGHAVDLITLHDYMQNELDGEDTAYLAQLVDGVPHVTNIEHYAGIVKEKAALRAAIHAADRVQQRAFDGDVEGTKTAIRDFPSIAATQGLSLVAVSVEDLLRKEIRRREMLLNPILPEQGLTMLYAYRGIGKTHLALGISAAVASGTQFLRWKAPRPRTVLYVDGELPASILREWSAMIVAGIEEGEPLPNALRFVTPDLQQRPMPDLATLEGQRLLEQHVAGVDLIVLDNLSALCRYGNENEGEGWLPVQEWALGLRRRGTSVLFVHHAGKNKTQRGTSRREDLLDTVITLKHPPDYSSSEGLRCEVHFEKTRSMLGDEAKPFEVRMESGSDGRAIWTCRDLEDAKACQAASLFSAGMSVRDVAEELGVSKSTAQRLRGRWTNDEPREVSRRPTS